MAKDSSTEIDSVPGLKDILDKAKKLVTESSEDKALIESTITELQNLAQSMSQMGQENKASGQADASKKKDDEDIIDAEIE